MKSRKIPDNQIDELVSELKANPIAEIQERTNEYEAFRGRIDGALIIVYTSGSVSYQSTHKIEQILSKYPEASPSAKVSKTTDLDDLNVKLTEKQAEYFIRSLSKIAEPEPTPGEYELAAFRLEGAKITIYTTGSVYARRTHSRFEELIVEAAKNHPTHPDYDIVIGQDEVGKGELFGPMIVGSVALTQDQSTSLRLKGVRDSKTLDADQIEDLSKEIKGASIDTKIVKMGARRFNEMYDEFKTEAQSLNDMLAWAHSAALEDTLMSLDSKGLSDKRILVIIDEFDRISTDKRLLKILEKRDIEIIQTPRAEDESVVVASASVLARFARDQEMIELREKVGLPLLRRNVETILRNPNARHVLRYVYLDYEDISVIGSNTVSGKEADIALKAILETKKLEYVDVEFKASWPQHANRIGNTIAAMANCDGGELYFGIKQNKKDGTLEVQGISSPQEIEERTMGNLRRCSPLPKVNITLFETTKDKFVLRFEIPMSEECICTEGTYYRRKGSNTTRMNHREIEKWPESCRTVS